MSGSRVWTSPANANNYLYYTINSSPLVNVNSFFADIVTPNNAQMNVGDIGVIIGFWDSGNPDSNYQGVGFGLRIEKTADNVYELQTFWTSNGLPVQLAKIGISGSPETRYRIAGTIIATHDTANNKANVYVDTLANMANTSGSMRNSNMYSHDHLMLGIRERNNSGSVVYDYGFVGKVYEAAVWNNILSNTDISTILDSSQKANTITTNLYNYWYLSDGDLLSDGGSDNHDLTLVGTVDFVLDTTATEKCIVYLGTTSYFNDGNADEAVGLYNF